MTKELLMLYGARYAVLEVMKHGGRTFSKIMGDTWQDIQYAEICNYLTDKIKEQQEENDCVN